MAFTTGRGGYGLDSHYGEPAVGQESLDYCMVMYGNLNQNLGESQPNSKCMVILKDFPKKLVFDLLTILLWQFSMEKNTRGSFFRFCQPPNKQI